MIFGDSCGKVTELRGSSRRGAVILGGSQGRGTVFIGVSLGKGAVIFRVPEEGQP